MIVVWTLKSKIRYSQKLGKYDRTTMSVMLSKDVNSFIEFLDNYQITKFTTVKINSMMEHGISNFWSTKDETEALTKLNEYMRE